MQRHITSLTLSLPLLLPTSSTTLHLPGGRRVGAAGFAADHRGQPAALAAAGVQPLLEVDGEQAPPLTAEERAQVAAAAAAQVAADPALRSSLLEGLSLFVSGALLAQQPGQAAPAGTESELAQLLPLLRSKLQQLADEAAAAATALLQTRVAAPAAEDEDADMTAAATSGQEQQGVLVPVAQLAWGDDAAEGQLPTSMPADLLQYPSCRGLQLQLLALQDAALSTEQLGLLAGGGLLRLLAQPATSQRQSAPQQLRQLVAAMAASGGGAGVADAAAYQLLLWLLEAQQAEGAGGDTGGSEWQQLLQRSLVHEAWFRWHASLWTGAATALPAVHASTVAALAQQQWAAAAAGPLRLHIAMGTVLASAVAAAPPTLIADRSARLLQLKLAARQLRAAAVVGDSSSSDGAAANHATAEWQVAASLAAATIAALLPSLPGAEQRQQLQAALAWMAGDRFSGRPAQAGQAEQDAQLLQLVSTVLASSMHPVLQSLLQPVLLPALQSLLEGSASPGSMTEPGAWWRAVRKPQACMHGTHMGCAAKAARFSPFTMFTPLPILLAERLLSRGRVLALLGLARLHLLVPPPGADPAAKYGLARQHVLSLLRCQVEPEQAVRRAAAALPGGPDEARSIAELEGQAAELEQQAERLQRRSTPRPSPPAYLTVGRVGAE